MMMCEASSILETVDSFIATSIEDVTEGRVREAFRGEVRSDSVRVSTTMMQAMAQVAAAKALLALCSKVGQLVDLLLAEAATPL